MPEQHVQLLTSLGVPKDVIDKIEAVTPETMKDFKVDDYTGVIASTYENKFLNDATFLGKIPVEKIPESVKKLYETGQYERFLNEMKGVAKELDIDISDIDEGTQRKLKDFTRTVLNKYGTKKGVSNDALQKVQSDLQKALEAKSEAETKAGGLVTEAVKNTSLKYQKQIQKLATQTILSSIEGLTAKPEYIVDALMNKIQAKYSVGFNEDTLQFELMQKDNPALKALDAAGKQINFNDEVVAILETDKMIVKPKTKEELEKEQKQNKERVVIEGAEGVVMSGSDKIARAMEGEKKAKTS
jgi:hypothetical protein